MLLPLFAACSIAPRGGIHFAVTPQKEDARITVHVEEDRAYLDIFSASGIGSADLEVTSQMMPSQIIMRFHLRGLEELRLSYHEAVITATLPSTKADEIRQTFNEAGAASTAARPLAPHHPQWMKIRIVPQAGAPAAVPLQQGYIEVEVPQSFIAGGHRRVTIHWIDFYR
jgi:hypothetical protein